MQISLASFENHFFGAMSDYVLLPLLQFYRKKFISFVDIMAWPASQSRTKRNRYSVTPLLVTCIVLRRLASACRWSDLESLFCLHTSHLSEIFWEGLMNFVSHLAILLMDDVHELFWKTRYNMYAEAVSLKSNALNNVVAF